MNFDTSCNNFAADNELGLQGVGLHLVRLPFFALFRLALNEPRPTLASTLLFQIKAHYAGLSTGQGGAQQNQQKKARKKGGNAKT